MKDPLFKFGATLKKYGMAPPGSKVLVACSGGADSVFLLAAFRILKARLGIEVGCIHVNHGMRGAEADSDEARVLRLAERMGVPFFPVRIGRGKIEAGRMRKEFGPEVAARDARYRALFSCAADGGYDRIALGHTLDDQVETFFLWLARGSDDTRFAGIYPVKLEGGKVIIRPLIETERREILPFLQRKKLGFCEDSTNSDERLPRNYIRKKIIPLFNRLDPSFRAKAGRLVELLRDSVDFKVARNVKKEYNKKIYVKVEPGERYLIKGLGKKLEVNEASPPGLPLSCGESKVYFDAQVFRPGAGLVLRSIETGDVMQPFGSGRPRKINEILSSGKVPKSARSLVPVVEHEGRIIWVCGVRRSAFAPVTARTVKVISMEYSDRFTGDKSV